MYDGFWITQPVGNNAFSYGKRQEFSQSDPRIWVPPIISGDLAGVRLGENVVFEEIDENEKLASEKGLSALIRFTWKNSFGREIPGVLVDNHNHVFFFWHEAWKNKLLKKQSKLIHIDAHTDLREPQEFLSKAEAQNLERVFEYTNYKLNVGNFILPAIETDCIDQNLIMITTEFACTEFTPEKIGFKSEQTRIIDIDLDFWAEDLLTIPPEKSYGVTRSWLDKADFISIATSPYFLEQETALQILRKLFQIEK
jgi:hypothetical protein